MDALLQLREPVVHHIFLYVLDRQLTVADLFHQYPLSLREQLIIGDVLELADKAAVLQRLAAVLSSKFFLSLSLIAFLNFETHLDPGRVQTIPDALGIVLHRGELGQCLLNSAMTCLILLAQCAIQAPRCPRYICIVVFHYVLHLVFIQPAHNKRDIAGIPLLQFIFELVDAVLSLLDLRLVLLIRLLQAILLTIVGVLLLRADLLQLFFIFSAKLIAKRPYLRNFILHLGHIALQLLELLPDCLVLLPARPLRVHVAGI